MRTILPPLLITGIIVGFGVWYFLQDTSGGVAPTTTLVPIEETNPAINDPYTVYTPPPAPPQALSESDTPTYMYKNEAYRFTLRYPQELEAREYKEAEGALSVVFENKTRTTGFQVYVTPYAEAQVTEERFRLDQPSGVWEEPVDVLVDGVRGTLFTGRNSVMGDTREVWFIRGGFLYEVATYKRLDSWLGEIMQTWKFI